MPQTLDDWIRDSQKCACVHPDATECMVQRYSTGFNREEVEEEVRICGGCECSCHRNYEEEYYDDYEDC